jgi:uncharacterized glyoxalase superfamily protein PhnB
MTTSGVSSINAFVPARDMEKSKRFYIDLGCREIWSSGDACGLEIDGCGFILQHFYVKDHAENFMMQLRVKDVASWWQRIQALGLKERYQLGTAKPPALQPWGLVVLYISDPTGVLWHIAEDPRK